MFVYVLTLLPGGLLLFLLIGSILFNFFSLRLYIKYRAVAESTTATSDNKIAIMVAVESPLSLLSPSLASRRN